MKKDLTIIIPIFNEEDNLERVEKELTNYLRKASLPTKVLLLSLIHI